MRSRNDRAIVVQFATLVLAVTLPLTRAAAATSVVVPARPAPIPTLVTDSAAVTALSADQLTHYIALKQALDAYWAAPAHAALLKTAKATAHTPTIEFGAQSLQINVFDYPALAKQDTALAALFSAHQFTPEQLEPTEDAAWQAVGTAVIADAMKAAGMASDAEAMKMVFPENSGALRKNVELVQAHRAELTAVGIDEGKIQ